MDKIAKYNIGDLVVHKRQGYRAVVIDIDPIFQASGRYNPKACKRDFAQRNPWYRLLVDESNQETYVEECLLNPDTCQQQIENPFIHRYLTHQQGRYQVNKRGH